jgi:hypothetical protein
VLSFQLVIPKGPGLHIETGYAWGLSAPHRERGARAAFGIATPTLPLGLSYLGAAIRVKYQVLYLEEIIEGPLIECVLH